MAESAKLKVKELVEASPRITELGQILQFIFPEKVLPLRLGAHMHKGDRNILLFNLFTLGSQIFESLTTEGTTGMPQENHECWLFKGETMNGLAFFVDQSPHRVRRFLGIPSHTGLILSSGNP